MKTNITSISVLICSLIVIADCVDVFAGRLYKWEDENGQLHYTDKRPTGIEYQEKHPEIDVKPDNENNMVLNPNSRVIVENPTYIPNFRGNNPDTLRPGERKLLNNYEQRVQQNLRAREKSVKEYENKQSMCDYYRQRYRENLDSSHGRYYKGSYQDIQKYCR